MPESPDNVASADVSVVLHYFRYDLNSYRITYGILAIL